MGDIGTREAIEILTKKGGKMKFKNIPSEHRVHLLKNGIDTMNQFWAIRKWQKENKKPCKKCKKIEKIIKEKK